jgi:hypothetical protein
MCEKGDVLICHFSELLSPSGSILPTNDVNFSYYVSVSIFTNRSKNQEASLVIPKEAALQLTLTML